MSIYWRGTANMVVEILPLNWAQVFALLQFCVGVVAQLRRKQKSAILIKK
ncbi:hypothetical protein [Coleofasciculus sp. E2-BRE-01]